MNDQSSETLNLLEEVASSKNLKRQMREAIARGKETGVEYGFPICRTEEGLVAGERETTKGSENRTNVVQGCPLTGGEFVGTFHCIPSDELVYMQGIGPLQASEAHRIWQGSEKHLAPEALRIRLGHGRVLSVTTNHPIFTDTQDAWVEAGELRLGDRVNINPEIPLPSEVGPIHPPVLTHIRKASLKHWPKLPSNPTRELMEYVGLVWSDGSILRKGHGGRVSFMNNDADLIEKFVRYSMRLFGLEATTRNLGTGFHATVGSTVLYEYFIQSLGFSKQRVPSLVWALDRDLASAFLGGVEAGDGSTSPVSDSKPTDVVTTISTGCEIQAANSLAYLVAALGKKVRVRRARQSWARRNHDYMYQVSYQVNQRRDTSPWSRVISIERVPGPLEVYDFETETGILVCGSGPVMTHNSHPKNKPYPSRRDLASAVVEKVTCTGGEDDRVFCLEKKPLRGKHEVKETIEELSYSEFLGEIPEEQYRKAVEKHYNLRELSLKEEHE